MLGHFGMIPLINHDSRVWENRLQSWSNLPRVIKKLMAPIESVFTSKSPVLLDVHPPKKYGMLGVDHWFMIHSPMDFILRRPANLMRKPPIVLWIYRTSLILMGVLSQPTQLWPRSGGLRLVFMPMFHSPKPFPNDHEMFEIIDIKSNK